VRILNLTNQNGRNTDATFCCIIPLQDANPSPTKPGRQVHWWFPGVFWQIAHFAHGSTISLHSSTSGKIAGLLAYRKLQFSTAVQYGILICMCQQEKAVVFLILIGDENRCRMYRCKPAESFAS